MCVLVWPVVNTSCTAWLHLSRLTLRLMQRRLRLTSEVIAVDVPVRVCAQVCVHVCISVCLTRQRSECLDPAAAVGFSITHILLSFGKTPNEESVMKSVLLYS